MLAALFVLLRLPERTMPHFHIHMRVGGEFIADQEGFELPNLAAAEYEALRGARSIMSAEVMDGRLRLDQALEIWSEDGQHLSTIAFADALEIVTASKQERQIL